MHFNFDAGRQDISEHPFTTSFGRDVRLTTRVDENDFSNMLWSCIHEGGHGLYEQGLPAEEYGFPLGEYCSLSIHESQSRLWENCIGRSLPFWKHNFALLKDIFPQQFDHISVDQFYYAVNKVQPSLIRTEADDVTYHFHVMIRYEIEKLPIGGSISAKYIPAYRNESYKNCLVLPYLMICVVACRMCIGAMGASVTLLLTALVVYMLHNFLIQSKTNIPILKTK